MEHKIKTLAEAITNTHTKNLVQSHVRELEFNEDTKHLTIHVANAGPLHELEWEEMDHHLKSALEKVYGEDITYELKLFKEGGIHEREKLIPHDISQ